MSTLTGIDVITKSDGNPFAPAPLTGASTARPSGQPVGTPFFDTTLGFTIWYNGTNWVNSAGVVQPNPPIALTVTNPGAESGTSGWTKNGTASRNTLASLTAAPHTGSRSFGIAIFDSHVDFYQDITLTQDQINQITFGTSQFQLKYWNRSIPRGDGKQNRGAMRIQNLDSGDAVLSATTDTYHKNSAYTQITESIVIPTNTVKARIFILMDQVGGHLDNEPKIYCDDITLEIIL